jgi:hypothetical protein
MTERVGTMGFCLLLLVWTAVWLAWNTLTPSAEADTMTALLWSIQMPISWFIRGLPF